MEVEDHILSSVIERGEAQILYRTKYVKGNYLLADELRILCT